MGAKEDAPKEVFSEEGALEVARKEYNSMETKDQATLLAKLRGFGSKSYVLVPIEKDGIGMLIETKRLIAELSGKT